MKKGFGAILFNYRRKCSSRCDNEDPDCVWEAGQKKDHFFVGSEETALSKPFPYICLSAWEAGG